MWIEVLTLFLAHAKIITTNVAHYFNPRKKYKKVPGNTERATTESCTPNAVHIVNIFGGSTLNQQRPHTCLYITINILINQVPIIITKNEHRSVRLKW